MGRLTPSVGQPPASFRRAARSKKAKATVNQLIPSLLPTHPRARKGIEASELIIDQGPVETRNAQSRDASPASNNQNGPRLLLQIADTLAAARDLLENGTAGATNTQGTGTGTGKGQEQGRVAVLNMASPLNPGGGFLNGANSQEESLCMRTTLLPSLKDNWYRLPELGAIYTPDVLVFRGPGSSDADDDAVLGKKDRWFVDCVSAAMLRNPDTERDELDRGRYVSDKDRQLAIDKMKMVMRVCQAKGIAKVVLGAWGCGAYGNPVGEVAAAWRKVLMPRADDGTGNSKNNDTSSNKKKKKGGVRENWSGVEEVVFAIRDPGMAAAFAEAFGEGLELEEDVDVGESEQDADNAAEGDGSDDGLDSSHQAELKARIREMETRIQGTTNPQLKAGLGSVLAGMNAQLDKA